MLVVFHMSLWSRNKARCSRRYQE